MRICNCCRWWFATGAGDNLQLLQVWICNWCMGWFATGAGLNLQLVQFWICSWCSVWFETGAGLDLQLVQVWICNCCRWGFTIGDVRIYNWCLLGFTTSAVYRLSINVYVGFPSWIFTYEDEAISFRFYTPCVRIGKAVAYAEVCRFNSQLRLHWFVLCGTQGYCHQVKSAG